MKVIHAAQVKKKYIYGNSLAALFSKQEFNAKKKWLTQFSGLQ